MQLKSKTFNDTKYFKSAVDYWKEGIKSKIGLLKSLSWF